MLETLSATPIVGQAAAGCDAFNIHCKVPERSKPVGLDNLCRHCCIPRFSRRPSKAATAGVGTMTIV